MTQHVYLSMGSNIGDPIHYLQAALAALDALEGCQLLAVSSLFQTPAWGKTDQPDFVNLACQVATQLNPLDFLDACQKIETDLGRVRLEKWGERTLDIDIVLWGEETLDFPRLQVPHPYMQERAFVLLPLVQLIPHFIHPQLGKNISQLLETVQADCLAITQLPQQPHPTKEIL